MKQGRSRGFTLIELLTVIAIISILTALTSVALPRMIEKARLTKLDGVFHSINVAMAEYYTQHASYPPSYGLIDFNARQAQIKFGLQIPEHEYFHLLPYLSYVKLHGVEDVHDVFGNSYDLNGDDVINLYEYSPIGTTDIGVTAPTFPKDLYDGSNNQQDVAAQLEADSRPMIYIPVNSRQFSRAQRYWLDRQDFHAKTWDASDPLLKDVHFPPASYDAFVLISVGPREDLGGVLPETMLTGTNIRPRDRFHIHAMRAYFLATRDMNQNNRLDYDFYARTREGEGKLVYDYKGATVTNELPAFLPNGQLDPLRKDLHGPVIRKFSK